MAFPDLTPEQVARYHEDRRPELYKSLIVLLVLNNIAVILRCIARYRTKDRDSKRFAIEDPLVLLTGVTVDVVIINLLLATKYGLGIHIWRSLAEDPDRPARLSNTFKHVWITMVLTGPVFTLIKLTLLFFYRRLFLINQKWLKVAWWINLVYVFLWLIGATGFYAFQCSPPTWYFRQYFHRFGDLPAQGHCQATTVEHVSMPLIFGLISDVAILCLPMFALYNLQISRKKKIGLIFLFCIGALACVLDMARIVELRVDTDDKLDANLFLILSAASEVAAVVCICLPVVVPWIWKEYKRMYKPKSLSYGASQDQGSSQSRDRQSKGFREIATQSTTDHQTLGTSIAEDSSSTDVELGTIGIATSGPESTKHDDGQIHVQTNVEVKYDRSWYR